MCGIFGFIGSGTSNGPTMANLKDMARAAASRGRHAFGFAWIDEGGRLHSYKQPGDISQHLDVLDVLKGARAVVGHTRHATHGDVRDNTNNHPHPVDGGWMVHNGIVSNHAELTQEHRLLPVSECDSEVIGLLMQRFTGSLMRRTVRTVEVIDEDAPLCVAAVWNRPNRVLVVRRGNPMFIGKGTTGNIYFCSCRTGLPGHPKEMDDNTAFLYDIGNGTFSTHAVRARSGHEGRQYAGSNWFSEASKPSKSEQLQLLDVEDDDYTPTEDELKLMAEADARDTMSDTCRVPKVWPPRDTPREKVARQSLSEVQRAALERLEGLTGSTVQVSKARGDNRIDPIEQFKKIHENVQRKAKNLLADK